MEVMIQRRNIILDATTLTTFQVCPRLGDYRFNHNLVPIEGKSKALEMGSVVHVFLEYFHKAIAAEHKRDKAIAFGWAMAKTYVSGCPECTDFESTPEIAQPRCGHKPNEFPGTNLDDESIQIVFTTIEQYLEYYVNDSWVPLEAECVKKKLIYSDDEIRILWKAKFDLIVDTQYGIKPVDHKTFSQRRDSLSLNNQFTGQTILVGSRDMIINKIGFQKTLKPQEKFTRPVISYSEDRQNEWMNEIVPYWAKMILAWNESGYFPPNYASCEGKYGKCDFADVCGANRNVRENELNRLFKVGQVWDI